MMAFLATLLAFGLLFLGLAAGRHRGACRHRCPGCPEER